MKKKKVTFTRVSINEDFIIAIDSTGQVWYTQNPRCSNHTWRLIPSPLEEESINFLETEAMDLGNLINRTTQ